MARAVVMHREGPRVPKARLDAAATAASEAYHVGRPLLAATPVVAVISIAVCCVLPIPDARVYWLDFYIWYRWSDMYRRNCTWCTSLEQLHFKNLALTHRAEHTTELTSCMPKGSLA